MVIVVIMSAKEEVRLRSLKRDKGRILGMDGWVKQLENPSEIDHVPLQTKSQL